MSRRRDLGEAVVWLRQPGWTLAAAARRVAGGLDDTAVVLGDFRIDQLAAQRFEAFERAFLVRSHSREYPATSAARIAARRRVWLMSPRQYRRL
ncbi:MAG: hypothetical protein JO095_03150 [Alphaproteobacteria bacterium]|nr:hypothetical protein [Alphaproteobacteria bacterium]